MMGGFELSAGVNADKVFLVKHSELEGRIDPHQYHHERINAIKAIKAKNKTISLNQLVFSTKQITTEINSQDIYIGLENILSNTGEYLATADKQSISSAGVFKKGQILFPKLRPYLNKVYLAEFDGICSTEFHIFEAKNINAEFLAIYLRSDLVVNQTKHLMTGNTLPRLQTEDIQKLPVPLVSNEIQSKVVTFYKNAYNQKQQKEQQAQALLDSIDGYLLNELGITLPEQDNRLEKRMFTVPFSELVGERIDSIYHHDKTVKVALNNSTYDLVKIKEKCTFLSGYAFSSDDYIESLGCFLVTIKNISKNIIDLSNSTFLPTQFYDDYSRFRIQKDDLVFAMTGATIGKVGIFVHDTKALLNQRNGIIRSDKMNTCFLMNLLNTSVYQSLILKNAVGGAQPNISETAITNLLIPLPPIEKQTEIATHISQIRAAAKQLQQDAAQILTSAKADIERMILGDAA